jgi:hypothetical protein
MCPIHPFHVKTEALNGEMYGEYIFYGRVRHWDGRVAILRKPVRLSNHQNGHTGWAEFGNCIGRSRRGPWLLDLPWWDTRPKGYCRRLESHFDGGVYPCRAGMVPLVEGCE